MENILKRDRRTTLTALTILTLLAWGYMAYEAHAMYSTGRCCCIGMQMSGPGSDPAAISTLMPLFLMWTEMMIAMMLPTAAPMILAFTALERKRHPQIAPFRRATLFTAGYLVIWTAFSVIAAIAQWQLNVWELLSPMMVSTSPVFGGLLLLLAGVFQFAPFKRNCLSHCREPETFLNSGWRDGLMGALRMGLHHGLKCTGCCWMLMALLFVGGVMNILWIFALTAFVLIEKVLPQVRPLTRFSGVALALWGGWLLLGF